MHLSRVLRVSQMFLALTTTGSITVPVDAGLCLGRSVCQLSLPPLARWSSVVAAECRREGVRRGINGTCADLRERQLACTQMISGQGHAPLGQVLHRRLTQRELKDPGERRA